MSPRLPATLAILLSVAATAAPGADAPARITFVEASAADATNPPGGVTAVGLRATALPAAAGPTEIVVLVDTSASQTGDFRRRSLDAVVGLLEKARTDDRLRVAAIDVDCTPLGEGFAPAADARAAARALDARTPLGSTDLVAGLEAAAALFGDGAGPRAVVYVGDGPGLAGVDPEEFARVVDLLRSRRIAVSSLGIGPQINWPCLAAVASATGGMLFVPEDDDAKGAGARIGALAVQPVAWPDDVAVSTGADGGAIRMLPGRLPPLRSDRDSVVLVEGPLDSGGLEFTLAGPAGGAADAKLTIPAAQPLEANAYLAELARNARDSDGIFLPLVGREGLELARGVIRGEAAALATLSRQAEAAGADDSALRLATASLRRDPDNPDAALVREVVQRRVEAGDDLPPPAAEPVSPPAAGRELEELAAMRQVRAQLLEQESAVRIREARQLLATDPDRAREILKEVQVLVGKSEDLAAADRDRLLRQLEMRIRESIVRSREKVDRDLASERRAAIGRERLRLTAELQRREERIKQLTERYNALVEKGIREAYAQPEYYPAVIDGEAVIGFETPTKAFVEAERVVGEEIAKEAPNLWAGHPIPMTARIVGRTAPLVARILEYDAENVRTKRDQERGFMDVLHLVDQAAIPFPDEPPIVYPTADRWREISRLREKYKSVDLANPGSAEKKIYEALETTVTRTFDFQETPLRAVISQLQDEFDIPIVPDVQALTDAGIDLDATTVTQKLSGIRLRSALRLLLREAGLTYLVKDEVLLITTTDKAQEDLVVKVYPVADLVLPVNPSAGLNPFQTGGGLGGQNSINSGMGGVGGGMGGGGMGGMGGGMGGFCWVAREVYGPHDPRWLVFRAWMLGEAPAWLREAYGRHGEAFAAWLHGRPFAKAVVRGLMDIVVESRVASPAGGAMFQVAEAKARVSRTEKPSTDLNLGDPAGRPSAAVEPAPTTEARVGLPESILDAADLREAVAAHLAAADAKGSAADPRAIASRMAQVRISAAELGAAGDFAKAAELISAALACGRAEPWMYESLALALEAAGRPRSEVERALLSSADFATSPVELLQLAHYLARFGSEQQAIRICRKVTRLDPASREAYALAMTLAARIEDSATLRWACAGVLAHEWPAGQQEIVARAARLAKATISALAAAGKAEEAAAFQADVDRALVRDFVIELSWSGDADIDLLVEEPPGTVCSPAAPRSPSGGAVVADDAGQAAGAATLRRERYVATEAFPGTYRALVRRAWGRPEADTVTAETVIHRGTDREQRQRQQIRLDGDESLIVVNLGEGRRREPLVDAQVAQDVAVQGQIGRTVLAQQLAALSDPQTQAELSASRAGIVSPPVPGLPFFRGGAVGYQPIVTTLPEGVNMFARAVVSADRRYVRITATPLFSSVGQVTTFNWVAGTSGQSGGGAGGFQGAGGVPGAGAVGGVGGQVGAGGQVGGQVGGGVGGVGGGVGGVGGGVGGVGGGAGGVGGGAGGIPGGAAGPVAPVGCWVAREVYGADNARWLLFRAWMTDDAPAWLRGAYVAHGEAVAAWIHDKPVVKGALRLLMDRAIADRVAH